MMNFFSTIRESPGINPHLDVFYPSESHVLGRIWRKISKISNQLYLMIQSIKNIVATLLLFYDSNGQSQHSKPPSKIGAGSLPSSSFGSIKFDLDLLAPDSGDRLTSQFAENGKAAPHLGGSEPLSQEKDDPLHQMGAIDFCLSNERDPLEGCCHDAIDQMIKDHAKQLSRRVNVVLERTKKKYGGWQECLKVLEHLDEQERTMTSYHSTLSRVPDDLFEEGSHNQIQDWKHQFEIKRNEIELDLCEMVQADFIPNPNILYDGHCLFSSIAADLNERQTSLWYRKQATHYIRQHPDKFRSALQDAMKIPEAQLKIKTYIKDQGGDQAIFDQLKTQLLVKPTMVDFYCHCFENTTMWGGMSEVIALSELLEVQILIFTCQDQNERWRLDFKPEEPIDRGKKTVLLYYDGLGHYQNLILRTCF
ncbi:MAG: hypothetical protein ACH350_00380 [Parachlamydiaceae bacterium]